MTKDLRRTVLNNLIGLLLGAIGIISFTAGTYFEILLFTLFISIPFLAFQLFRQTSFKWVIIIIGILLIQIYSFYDTELTDLFKNSLESFILSSDDVEGLKWILPVASGFCLTSFWVVLISTLKEIKTLPNNS